MTDMHSPGGAPSIEEFDLNPKDRELLRSRLDPAMQDFVLMLLYRIQADALEEQVALLERMDDLMQQQARRMEHVKWVEAREAAERARSRLRRDAVRRRLARQERDDYRILYRCSRDPELRDYCPAIMARIIRRRTGATAHVDAVVLALANELDISDRAAEALVSEGFVWLGSHDLVAVADFSGLPEFQCDLGGPGLNMLTLETLRDEMVIQDGLRGEWADLNAPFGPSPYAEELFDDEEGGPGE